MQSITVLFSSVGRRVELIECFRRAGERLGVNVRVVGCDLNPSMSAACAVADKRFTVPRCNDPEFVPALLEICRSERVGLLVPTIDTELETLAQHARKFRDIGTLVSISSPEIVKMARNKLLTHQFLTEIGVPSPRSARFTDLKAAPGQWRFPVILKHVDGSSSIGIHHCQRAEDLEAIRLPADRYMAQELYTGNEYTVNMFFDGERLRCAVPHLRFETRAGEVSKGITRRVPALIPAIQKLGAALAGKAFSALCFQAIVTEKGEIAVFEINARFGGGYPLTDRAGGTFAEWLLELALGIECTGNDNWQENVKMLRYDAAVFGGDERG